MTTSEAKAAAAPLTTESFFDAPRARFAPYLSPQMIAMLLSLVVAVGIGFSIGLGKWPFVILMAAVPLVILWPVQLSLGIFALLIPFDSVGALGQDKSGMTVTFVAGAATAGLLLFTGIAGRRMDKPRSQTLAWALFVGWALLTAAWALNVNLSLAFLPTVMSLLTIYFATTLLRFTRKEFTWIVGCTILGGLAAALYSINSFRHGVSYHGLMTMRSSLIIGNRETDPNDYANNLLLPLSLAVGVVLTARRRTAQMLALAVAAIIMIAIILTMSRGGLLSVFAMAIVYLYRFRLRMKALIPVAIMALALLAAPSLFFQRIFSAVDSGGAGRTHIWKAGFVAFQHYPIFGAGLGNFPAAFDRFAGEAPRFEGYGRGSHNIYLGVSVEFGVIGLLLLLLAFRQQLRGRQFSSVPSPWHAAIACEAAAWGMLVGGFFLDITWKKGFWFVWIMLAVAARFQQNPTRSSGQIPEPAPDRSLHLPLSSFSTPGRMTSPW